MRLKFRSIFPIATLSTLLFCSPAFATVGGPEHIEVLGFDHAEQKIYLLRHYHDQYGRLPQLYYYQLTGETPTKLIEVKSIYQKLKRQNQQQYENAVAKAVDQIKQRLSPLDELDTRQATIFVIDQHVEHGNLWQHTDPNDAFEVVRYTQDYQIRNTQFLSDLQTSTSYQNNQMKTVQLYSLTNNRYQLAVIEYLGIPFESGYNKQDAVLLKFDPEN